MLGNIMKRYLLEFREWVVWMVVEVCGDYELEWVVMRKVV